MAKKTNPVDVTLRNVRAAKRREAKLAERIEKLEAQLADLHARLTRLELAPTNVGHFS